MSSSVIFIDIFGFVLALLGFHMAFRQSTVRRLLGRPASPSHQSGSKDSDDDPLTYVLRIAGIMIMVFGIVVAGMVTLFNVA